MNTEQEILELNSPTESYRYVYENPDKANIEKHEEVIINSKNIFYCYYFAKYVPNANIKKIEKVIIDSKDVDFCYWFARDIPGSDKQSLSEVVLTSGNFFYIKSFYEHVEFDKSRYETLLLFI
jgi:hypothetical protein